VVVAFRYAVLILSFSFLTHYTVATYIRRTLYIKHLRCSILFCSRWDRRAAPCRLSQCASELQFWTSGSAHTHGHRTGQIRNKCNVTNKTTQI